MQVVHTQKRKKGVVMAITMLIAAFFFFPCSAAEFSFTGMCSITNVEAPQPPAPLPDPKLTASFNRWPEQGVAPLTVYFNETSYGNIAQWSWNFGDGATATGTSAQHTFQAPGDYTVLLTVIDSLGATNQTATIIHVIAPVIDTDGDGLPDALEKAGCTKFNDADSDDDGVPDGVEDANHNGIRDGFETNPCNRDSDGDGIQDGTELGYTLAYIGPDTDLSVFQRDVDTATLTDPLLADSNGDANHNGMADNQEPANTPPVAYNAEVSTTLNVPVSGTLTATDAENDPLVFVVTSPGTLGVMTGFDPRTGAFTYTPNTNASGTDTISYRVYDGTAYSNTATITVIVKPNWDNYRVSLTMRSDDNDAMGMMFRYQDRNNYYRFAWDSERGYRRLTKRLNGVTTILAGDAVPYVPGNTYQVQLVANGSTLEVWVDGVMVLTAADIDLVDGTVAFYSWNNAGSSFDNLLIEDLASGIVLLREDFTSGDLGSWLLVDEGDLQGPSAWSAVSGVLVQNSDIHSGPEDDSGLDKLGTFAVYGHAPVADPATLNVIEDMPASGVLTGSDLDGSALTFVIAANGSQGTAVVTYPDSGAFTYTPAANASGADTFTFRVYDGTTYSAPATVAVSISPVGDAPVAVNDVVQVNEDSSNNIFGVLANDFTPDLNTTLTIEAVGSPNNGGTAVINNGSIIYTPAGNFAGVESFAYTIRDSAGLAFTATVIVTVLPMDDPPVAVDDALTASEDGGPSVLDVLANDSDPDAGDSLTIIAVGLPDHGGSASHNGATVSYTPATNFSGQEGFSYTIQDSTGRTATATVTMTVTNTNDASTATGQSLTTAEDTPVSTTLNATDLDGNGLTYSIAANGSKGTATITNPATGAFTYTPAANVSGTDSFTFKANDGTVDSNIATVSITITPENDAPTAVADTATTTEETPVTIAVLANDTDVDGDALTVASVTAPGHGSAVISGNSVVYTPTANFSGIDTFSYTVSDGNGATATATVTVTVANTNDGPTALSDSATTSEDIPVTIAVLSNDTDADGDALAVVSVTTPTHGTAVSNSTNVIYTPAANYVGADTFSYTITDGHGGTSTATVTVNVVAVNDAPTANNGRINTTQGIAVNGTLTGSDQEGSSLTYSLAATGTKGTAVITNAATGAYTYTPLAQAIGTDTFTFKANDGTLDSNIATVTVDIKPEWTAYRVSLLMSSEDDDELGVIFRRQDDDNYYRFSMNREYGYRRLVKKVGGVFTLLAEEPNLYVTGQAYQVEITAEGDQLTVKVDGAQVFAVQDNAIPQGRVALYSWHNTGSRFDDLRIEDLVAGRDYLLTDFSSTDLGAWSVLDETDTTGGPSAWSVINGHLTQSTDIYSEPQLASALAKAGTYIIYGLPPTATDLIVNTHQDTPVFGNLTASLPSAGPMTYSIVNNGSLGTAVITNPATGAFTYTPRPGVTGTDTILFRASNGLDSNEARLIVNIAGLCTASTSNSNHYTCPENSQEYGDSATCSSACKKCPTGYTWNATNQTCTANPSCSQGTYSATANTCVADSTIGCPSGTSYNATRGRCEGSPTCSSGTYNASADKCESVGTSTYAAGLEGNGASFLGNEAYGTGFTITGGQIRGRWLAVVNTTSAPLTGAGVSSGSAITIETNNRLLRFYLSGSSISNWISLDSPNAVGEARIPYGGTFLVYKIEVNNRQIRFGDGIEPSISYGAWVPLTYTCNAGDTLSGTTCTHTTTTQTSPTCPSGTTLDGTTDTCYAASTPTCTSGMTYDAALGKCVVAAACASPGTLDTALDLCKTGLAAVSCATTPYSVTNWTCSIDGSVYPAEGTCQSSCVSRAQYANNLSLETMEDTPVLGRLLASSPNGGAVAYTLLTQPTKGAIANFNPATGSFGYSPAAGVTGIDTFTYKANDGTLDSNIATVTVTITPVNDAPVATGQSLTTAEDTPVSTTLSATDLDGSPLTYSIVANGSKGTATITNPATGAFSYTPQANVNGSDSFTFKANDGMVDSNTATVTITITPVNDAPVANNSSISITQNTPVSTTLSATDVDGNPLIYSLVANGNKGTATITNPATGAFSYTPVANATGTDSFTFKANDGALDSNIATVTITIITANPGPVAVDDSATTSEDTPVTIAVLSNDTDADGDALTVTSVTTPAHGTAVISGASVVYTPAANFTDTDTFTYTISDGHGGTATATVTVTVINIPAIMTIINMLLLD